MQTLFFLTDPKFVGSAVIPDNDDRDDDKVYFFFTEVETDAEGVQKAVYTRVGRVCAVRMLMPDKDFWAGSNSSLCTVLTFSTLLYLSE